MQLPILTQYKLKYNYNYKDKHNLEYKKSKNINTNKEINEFQNEVKFKLK